jgi:hypothetical protein
MKKISSCWEKRVNWLGGLSYGARNGGEFDGILDEPGSLNGPLQPRRSYAAAFLPPGSIILMTASIILPPLRAANFDIIGSASS